MIQITSGDAISVAESKSLVEQRLARTVEDHVEVDEKPWAPKHGPARLRYLSAGQQRRATLRAIESGRRKQTKRSRKAFHRQNLAVAVLRGQLQAVGVLPRTTPVRPGDVNVLGALLEANFGSLEAAGEAYAKAVA